MDDDADRFAILALLGFALALASVALLGFTVVGLAIALTALVVPVTVLAVPIAKALARRCFRPVERRAVVGKPAANAPLRPIGRPVEPGISPTQQCSLQEKGADEALPDQPS